MSNAAASQSVSGISTAQHMGVGLVPTSEVRPPVGTCLIFRAATPDNEWRNVLCQRHDRSHATSDPPSNDAPRGIFCSAESPNRFPGFINTTFENSPIPDGVAANV